MPSQRVIVELSPSRVEVALVKGNTVADSRCERFGRAEWPTPYTTALPEATAALTKLLSELGVAAGEATVIYSAPGSATGLTSCSTGIGMAAAEQAAILSLANGADFPLDGAPTDTCILLTDRSAKKAAKDSPTAEGAVVPAAGTGPQRHILAAAEAEQRAAALGAAVNAAGLRTVGIIPADAVALADCVRQATSVTGDELAAVVWVGEHTTNLAVGASGRLLFVRTIATGAESLVEVLCRPLRPRDSAPTGEDGAPAQPITLAHNAARGLLFSVGLPGPNAEIPGYPTLAGSSLLPHMQPVLQRLSIEIKQTLRFGVPESDRPRVRIHLAGPGASISGLAEAIARGSGFALAGSNADSDTDPRFRAATARVAPAAPSNPASAAGGLIAALLRCPVMWRGGKSRPGAKAAAAPMPPAPASPAPTPTVPAAVAATTDSLAPQSQDASPPQPTTGVSVRPAAPAPRRAAKSRSSLTELVTEFLFDVGPAFALRDGQARDMLRLRRTRKALIAGAGLAMIYVGYETADAQLRLSAERARLISLNANSQSVEGPAVVRQQTMTARQELTEVERRVRRAMDEAPDWAAMMGVIAEKTPEQVRLQTISMRKEGSGASARPFLSVRGYIRFGEVRDPATLIHTYVGQLEAVPIVESVRLGATQRVTVSGHDAQTFDLTLGVVSLPPVQPPPPTDAAANASPSAGTASPNAAGTPFVGEMDGPPAPSAAAAIVPPAPATAAARPPARAVKPSPTASKPPATAPAKSGVASRPPARPATASQPGPRPTALPKTPVNPPALAGHPSEAP